MTALYSVNLHIMGRSNVPLPGQRTVSNYAERLGASVLGGERNLNVWGWEVTLLDASMLAAAFLTVVLLGLMLYAFFQTNLGAAMRATGDNSQMIRALGVNDDLIGALGVERGGVFVEQKQIGLQPGCHQ